MFIFQVTRAAYSLNYIFLHSKIAIVCATVHGYTDFSTVTV
jgi:hypothetical protein